MWPAHHIIEVNSGLTDLQNGITVLKVSITFKKHNSIISYSL